MIAAKDNARRLNPDEYFAWEKQQLEKHEYINGALGWGHFPLLPAPFPLPLR